MPTIEIHPLTPARLDDYLQFFDTRAFADNKEWSRCYCYYPYCELKSKEWDARTAIENRTSITAFINDERARGYLAYDGSDVVGWCNAATLESFSMLEGMRDLDVDRAGAIVCFVVCPTHRGQGIAKSLLGAACDGLKADGLLVVYAKPFKGASTTAENFPGPLSMYLEAGFQTVREDDRGNVIVKKQLA
ncbi:MAG TPA: GNAT family N-acetyltransferase [Steroidobacteraceae bacterium]|nr:GNAT family N-acetyltransferase [Steroidobacteraceae bacterium]